MQIATIYKTRSICLSTTSDNLDSILFMVCLNQQSVALLHVCKTISFKRYSKINRYRHHYLALRILHRWINTLLMEFRNAVTIQINCQQVVKWVRLVSGSRMVDIKNLSSFSISKLVRLRKIY